MHKIFRKMMTVGVAASLMVTCVTHDVRAFGIPLLSYDIPRVAENVKKISATVQQVKAEVDSHRQIIKQIQQGGFGAAAGMLFAKVENGDYDRLFGSFSALGADWKANKAMAGKRAEIKAQCEKESQELVQKTTQEAQDKCKEEQPEGGVALQKCLDGAMNAAKKAGNKSKKECLKQGYAELSKELAKVRAEMYEQAQAKYAEAKAKNKAYTWLQNAGLSRAAFSADDTARAIADGRIGDAISFGSSALGNSSVSFGIATEESASSLEYIGGVAGGVAQDMKDGYGIWGKMGLGGSNKSGGSTSSSPLDVLNTDESGDEDADADNEKPVTLQPSSDPSTNNTPAEKENGEAPVDNSQTSTGSDQTTAPETSTGSGNEPEIISNAGDPLSLSIDPKSGNRSLLRYGD